MKNEYQEIDKHLDDIELRLGRGDIDGARAIVAERDLTATQASPGTMATTSMKLIEPVALFDLDGTLADFEGAMKAKMQELATPGEQAFYQDQEAEPQHIKARRRAIKRQPGFWSGLVPLQLGFMVFDACITLKYQINILSKAPGTMSGLNAWSEKAEWCYKHLGDRYPKLDFSISLVQDKGLHYGRVLTDDWPSYILRWLTWRPRGLVIMPAADYNEAFEHPNVIRFDGTNLAQVHDALERQRGLDAG